MQQHALVTGGAGFIGSHIVELLIEHGWTVRVLDLDSPVPMDGVDWIRADVRDREAMVTAARGASMVFHLGTLVGVERVLEDPVKSIDVTVNGTLQALEAAACAGAGLVHLSSSEVLGKNPELPWGEDAERVLGSPLVDRWSYAAAKAAAEHVVVAGARARQIPATVIRPFNVYGPRQSDRFVIARMVAAALGKEPIEVHGEGLQSRCFTYVSDVAEAIVRTGEHPGVAPVLHIGSTEESTIVGLASLIEELTGSKVTRRHDLPSPRHEDVDRRVPETTEAAIQLEWKATTSLRDGLKLTIDWMRQAP